MRVTIMQPYFFPYAGYYRLFKESDIFVIYDCVQFPRRGWVHRNKLKNFSNDLDWLTLPITKPNYEDRILNINLRKNYKNLLIERFTKFPVLTKYKKSKMIDELLLFELKHPFSIVDYIEQTFFYTLEILNINENCTEANKKYSDKVLSIWDINSIPDFK